MYLEKYINKTDFTYYQSKLTVIFYDKDNTVKYEETVDTHYILNFRDICI